MRNYIKEVTDYEAAYKDLYYGVAQLLCWFRDDPEYFGYQEGTRTPGDLLAEWDKLRGGMPR